MTNRIVAALEHAATRLGKTLGEDAGKAVGDLYHSTGHNLTGIAEDTTAADLKHETALRGLMHDSKQPPVHAPHDVSDTGHLPHGNGDEPPLGGEHAPGQPSEGNGGCTTGGDPVDVVSGQMITSATDIDLPGLLPVMLRRAYASGYTGGRWFGPGWASTLDQRIQIDPDGIHYAGEDAEIQHYPLPTSERSQVLPKRGVQRPLTWDRDSDTIRIEDSATGWTRHFAPPPRPGARTRTITTLTDRNGHRIDYTQGPDGLPAEICHSGGYRIAVDTVLTPAGPRITGLRLLHDDAGSAVETPVVQYTYDGRGRLSGITDSTGLPLIYHWDDQDRIISWTDRNNHWYAYEYGPDGRVTRGHGPRGALETHFEYDLAGRVTTMTSGLGEPTEFHYDQHRHLVQTVDPLGGTIGTEYDRFGRLLSRTDELGRTTRVQYDAAARPVAVIRPDGREVTAAYNGLGLPSTIIDADGSVWQQEFDSAGNRTVLVEPNGATSHYAYDVLGHLTAVTDALGRTTTVRCDPSGLPVESTDPLGATTRYRRDAFGRIIAITNPLGATTRLDLTTEGKVTRAVHPDGSQESWSYDAEGNCTAHVDPIGGTTRYEYTHFNLPTAKTDPDGTRYEFTHDAALRLTQVTNPLGATWTYRYDPAGRLVHETDFDGRTLAYSHDAAGRLAARTNALGQTVSYEHDLLGNIAAKTADGRTTRYERDPLGRLLQAADPEATLAWQRDPAGRVTSETCNGRTLTYAYDVLGRRTRRTTPSGVVSVWEYDATDHPVSLTTAGRTLSFEHDLVGRQTARGLGAALTLAQAWDELGRLTTQSLNGGRSGTVLTRAYTYRADGRPTGLDDSLSGHRAFERDAMGRVTAVRASDWSEAYAYDEAGNQTAAHWPEDHPGQDATGPRAYTGTRIHRAGSLRYEHDGQGRIILRQKTRLSRKPDTWRYTWDTEDRLTSVTTPDGTVWRYLYDPLGRRIAKQRLADDGTIAEETAFCWDDALLAEQTTTSPQTPNSVTLTWDHDGLHPVTQTERMTDSTTQQEIDQRFFAIVTDLVGAPTHLVDESGGIAWHSRTTLWGSTTWPAASTAFTPLRFPGQYFDQESGLHYNVHRYYDPETARYATTDPLGLVPAPNPTTYVDDPHTSTDPLGLTESCHIVYRNLRPDEDPRVGLVAKNPDATYTPAGHVLHGSRPNWRSQYISTTRSREVALGPQWTSGRVVAIDLSKIHDHNIFDLSTDAGRAQHGIRGFTAINRTKSSMEVLITGHIPPEAITWVEGGP
ncbi:DUF6531 domain-containing protein [Actinacidiphila acididurans]|uniref:RHS repeat protein n=1 Tax=Actinacidiphila acididurans TaxID=2784346 RepID=A0ABS2TSU1_9ACTN|nr:DUF6531 domain-containing protein [Actinacidiphila acididurans]MBM9506142.1 RHS repeat protein [Actinacidiphila acididurans]